MSTTTASSRSVSRLALAAVVGCVVYVAIDLVLFFLRPDMSLLHNAESDYGNGPYSWLMDINFEVRFLLSLAAGAALWIGLPRGRWLGRVGVVLIWVWAVASGVLGFSRDDLEGAAVTLHGLIHLIFAQIGFLACAIGTLLLTIEFFRLRWGLFAVVAAVIWVIGAVGLLVLAHVGFRPHTLDGLFERIFIGAQILWIAIVSARLALGGRVGPPGP
jgi:hypothetical protein